jgi:hypothetical protein
MPERGSVLLASALVVALTAAGWAQESSRRDARVGAAAGFETLKALEGRWRGVDAKGRGVDVSVEVVSGGTAVLETMAPEGEPTMVTVFHLDGDEIGLTHYCSSGNQPRLRAAVAAQGTDPIGDLRFRFRDATNLETPTAGHIDGLTITFRDPDHIRQE